MRVSFSCRRKKTSFKLVFRSIAKNLLVYRSIAKKKSKKFALD